MSLPSFLGRAGLARYLSVSETRIGQLNVPPDALADGRPLWTPETAARLKFQRDQRLAARISRRRPNPQAAA